MIEGGHPTRRLTVELGRLMGLRVVEVCTSCRARSRHVAWMTLPSYGRLECVVIDHTLQNVCRRIQRCGHPVLLALVLSKPVGLVLSSPQFSQHAHSTYGVAMRFAALLFVVFVSSGCAGIGVATTSDPLKKLNDAEDLFVSQGRPLLAETLIRDCLLYTSPSPRDKRQSRMPSSA